MLMLSRQATRHSWKDCYGFFSYRQAAGSGYRNFSFAWSDALSRGSHAGVVSAGVVQTHRSKNHFDSRDRLLIDDDGGVGRRSDGRMPRAVLGIAAGGLVVAAAGGRHRGGVLYRPPQIVPAIFSAGVPGRRGEGVPAVRFIPPSERPAADGDRRYGRLSTPACPRAKGLWAFDESARCLRLSPGPAGGVGRSARRRVLRLSMDHATDRRAALGP